jgi:tetratricopeptide (TPR) repeat protein
MLTEVVDPSRAVYAPALLALAEVQRALGRLDAAIASYAHASQLMGFERDALVPLAECLQEKGDTEGALRALERARPYFPPNDQRLNDLIMRLRAGR